MNKKILSFTRNFSYTLSANLISLLISSLVILIIPKLVGIEEYGYWQLYLFYSSYVGLLHFGWDDGIYLRYGGKEYHKLNHDLLFSQFYMLLIFQLVVGIIIGMTSIFIFVNTDKIFILQMTAICTVLSNLRAMLLFVLQATLRIKEYAKITILDKVVYFLLLLALLMLGIRDYKIMVIADLIGRGISLIFAIYVCREVVLRKFSNFKLSIFETKKNILAGMNVMASNYVSMLIIGVVRIGIERTWSVAMFAKVSLTLSASNIMMLFINAVGIIVFPILRRTDTNKLPQIYLVIRELLTVLLFGLLIAYYPLKSLLSIWLPDYSDSLTYMALTFPMFIYEGRMSLLINNYLKTLRKEKLMLKINVITLILSIVVTIITTIILKDINLAVVSIVFLLVIKSFMSEYILIKDISISVYKDTLLELILTIIFICSGWIIDSWLTFLIYGLSYSLYLVIKRKEIHITIKKMKLLISK